MLKSTGLQTHYKMYKKGRFWVFAGITLLSWQLTNIDAHANTATTNNSATPQADPTTVATTTASTNQVVLTPNESQATSTNQAASSTTVSAAKNNESTANTAAKEQPSATDKPDVPDNSGTTSSEQNSTATSTPDTSIQDSKQSPTTENVTAQPKTTGPQAPASVSASPDKPIATTAPNSESRPVALKTNATTQLSRNNLLRSTVEDGGWTVTDDGAGNVVLHFSGGTMLKTAGRAYDQPWRADYASKITEIDFDGPVTADKDLSDIFENLSSLTTVRHAELLDTSNTTNMAYMFADDDKLTTVNGINSWNTANVTDLTRMFFSDWKLTSLDVNSWDTSNVTTMTEIFEQTGLISLDLSNWKTGKVTDLGGMFGGDSHLTSLNLIGPGWNTANVTNMGGLFGSTNIANLLNNVRNWNTAKVTNMAAMFYQANLTSWDIENWDTSQVTSMNMMLSGNSFSSLNLNNWDTSKVTNMANLFSDNSELQQLSIDKWQTSQVTDMSGMFEDCVSLISLDANQWDTSSLTNLTTIFRYCEQLTTLKINLWNVSKVTDAEGVFDYCSALTTLNLDHWDTRHMTNMSYIFSYAGIHTITLGPETILSTDCKLTAHTTNAIWGYTGNWVNTADPTDVLTDADLISAYNVPRNVTLTYTWQYLPTITLKNSTLKLGTTGEWPAADGLVTATDEYGKIIDSTNPMLINDSSTAINKQALGTYTVTFSLNYPIAGGNAQISKTATVTVYGIVLAQQTISKSTTASWSILGNVQQAISKSGNTVTNFNTISYTRLGLTKPGIYTVTYTLADFTTSATVTVTSAAQLIGQPVAVEWGHTWNRLSALASAVDENGDKITDFNNIVISGNVNTGTPGRYFINYSYTDKAGNTVTSGPTTVAVYGIALINPAISKITTAHWDPATNIRDAIGLTGDTLAASDLIISRADGGNISDLTKPGIYTINYGLENGYSNSMTINVISHASVLGQKVILKLGEPWNATQGILRATDENNNVITDFSRLKVSNTVDSQTPGVYMTTYSYTDAAGNVTSSVPTHVIIYGIQLDKDSFTKSTTATWNPTEHISAAVDATGKTIAPTDVTVTIPAASHNLTLPGTYDLTYALENGYTTDVKMTVTNQAQLIGQTVAIKLGTIWNPQAGIKTAIDENGNPLSNFEQVTGTDNVDPTQLGIYDVTYTYTDAVGNQTNSDTVHVIVYGFVLAHNNLTKSTTGTISLADNVIQALDRTGKVRTGSELAITTSKSLTQPGQVPVVYALDDYSVPATVTVTDAAKLIGQTTSVKLGNQWNPSTGILLALDENGQPLTDYSQLTTTGDLDLTTLGIYTVRYHYTDTASNETISEPVSVIVYGLMLTDRTKTLTPNSNWQPLDNVKIGVMPTGKAALPGDITVALTDLTGHTVSDLTVPGHYIATYQLADDTASAQLTVLSLATINVHDVTLTTGSTWHPESGFTSATAADGQPLTASQLAITGQVDTNTVGNYSVTYSYTDPANQITTQTILVTVKQQSKVPNLHPTISQDDQGSTDHHLVKVTSPQPATTDSTTTQLPVQMTHKSAETKIQSTTINQDRLQPLSSQTAEKIVKSPRILPQTDEATSKTTIMGLLLLTFSSLLFGFGHFRLRRHN